MSLKDKSEFNFESIKILQERGYYSPTIHCAYYGALQLCIHQLYVFHKKTESEIDNEIHYNKGGSNQYYINFISTDIIQNYDRRKGMKLADHLNLLKSYRNRADYYNTSIDCLYSVKAEELAVNVKNIINEIY